LKTSPGDDLCEPGPGVWPLRLAKRHRGGERMTAAPAQIIVGRRRDKFKVARCHGDALIHLSEAGWADAARRVPSRQPASDLRLLGS
jgi:hypothetical protein